MDHAEPLGPLKPVEMPSQQPKAGDDNKDQINAAITQSLIQGIVHALQHANDEHKKAQEELKKSVTGDQ